MCFVWIWEQTTIISLYSIDWLVFITETECVYCAVRSTFYVLPTQCVFVWTWEQTAIISLYSIDWLVFITETECVYCAVRTGSFYIIQVSLGLIGFNYLTFNLSMGLKRHRYLRLLGCVVSNELRRIWKEVVVAWYGELSKTLNWPCDLINTKKCCFCLIDNDFARARLETDANPPECNRLLLEFLPRNSTVLRPISICTLKSFACLRLGLATGLFPHRLVTYTACHIFREPSA